MTRPSATSGRFGPILIERIPLVWTHRRAGQLGHLVLLGAMLCTAFVIACASCTDCQHTVLRSQEPCQCVMTLRHPCRLSHRHQLSLRAQQGLAAVVLCVPLLHVMRNLPRKAGCTLRRARQPCAAYTSTVLDDNTQLCLPHGLPPCRSRPAASTWIFDAECMLMCTSRYAP